MRNVVVDLNAVCDRWGLIETLVIKDAQVKTSLEVPLSDAAADVLWRIIERARKNRST